LRRSFQPDDLLPELTAAGVNLTVAVEAADSLQENTALLAKARARDWIAGVVGWVPLAEPGEVERGLDAPMAEGALVAQRVPELRIVIDHFGKPPIAARALEPWSSLIARAARLPNVFAKLSGLDAGGAKEWTAVDIAPYIDRALELFGPNRLMFGSDWPVADLRGGYNKVWRETNRTLARLSRDERDRIRGGTAIAFYRLPINTPGP